VSLFDSQLRLKMRKVCCFDRELPIKCCAAFFVFKNSIRNRDFAPNRAKKPANTSYMEKLLGAALVQRCAFFPVAKPLLRAFSGTVSLTPPENRPKRSPFVCPQRTIGHRSSRQNLCISSWPTSPNKVDIGYAKGEQYLKFLTFRTYAPRSRFVRFAACLSAAV
jgi:hypothetical protein